MHMRQQDGAIVVRAGAGRRESGRLAQCPASWSLPMWSLPSLGLCGYLTSLDFSLLRAALLEQGQ